MPFSYAKGIAGNTEEWLAAFEKFVKSIGWTVEAGGIEADEGMTLRSVGEAGAYSKLFAQVRRIPGESYLDRPFIRLGVRDALSGISNRWKSLTPPLYEGFNYWFNGDKEFVNMGMNVFGSGIDYWDYAGFGCVADFTAPILDESGRMAVAGRAERGIELDWLDDASKPDMVPCYHRDAGTVAPDPLAFADLSIERDSVAVGRIPHISRNYLAVGTDRVYLVVRPSIEPPDYWYVRII